MDKLHGNIEARAFGKCFSSFLPKFLTKFALTLPQSERGSILADAKVEAEQGEADSDQDDDSEQGLRFVPDDDFQDPDREIGDEFDVDFTEVNLPG